MRNPLAFAAAIIIACISTAVQSATYVKHTEVNVVITGAQGGQAELALGYNILGSQHAFGCDNDEGCLVTIASMVEISHVTGYWSICTLVDGQPTSQHCPRQSPPPDQGSGVGNGLASVLLSKGSHQFETGVVLKDNAGARLGMWEVHYTRFVDPPHGHDQE